MFKPPTVEEKRNQQRSSIRFWLSVYIISALLDIILSRPHVDECNLADLTIPWAVAAWPIALLVFEVTPFVILPAIWKTFRGQVANVPEEAYGELNKVTRMFEDWYFTTPRCFATAVLICLIATGTLLFRFGSDREGSTVSYQDRFTGQSFTEIIPPFCGF